MTRKVSIIVPNWNGRAFLSRCVGGLLQSATEYGAPFELLLMDDASSDGSAEETASAFPAVRLEVQTINQGFGHTVNHGASLATGEILVLVNNDLIPRAGFIENLCRPFEEADDLFGVSAKTVDWDAGAPNHVNMTADFIGGHLQLKWSDDAVQTPTMFMQGGSCAVRRDLFLKFGGFHPLYAPAYWEDYDLCYQALKAGYRNVYEPSAVGSHLGQGSMIRAYGEERVNLFKTRNRLLFLALNMTDDGFQRQFWNSLPEFVRSAIDARFKIRMEAFLYLVSNSRAIKEERQRRAARQQVTDSELFARFAALGNPCA
jgi:GT2 family glycosyltransferase